MVSLITNGRAVDRRGRPYPRRRTTPALVVGAVLAAIALVVWITVWASTDTVTSTMACNAPPSASTDPDGPAPAPLGTVVDRSTIRDVQPAALSGTSVRVFNASGERGGATQVAAQLGEYGFTSPPDLQAGNDPVYVDQNLQCQGQIRFGESGTAAASTVALVAPCAELVRDERQDATVDLALGTLFKDLDPSPDAQEVLRSLQTPAGTDMPPVDMDLVRAAHSANC